MVPTQNHNKFWATIAVVVVLCTIGFGYVYIQNLNLQNTAPKSPVNDQVNTAYNQIPGSNVSDQDLETSLQTFRDIAANENNSPRERAKALNGINYAYTQSDFDASAVRDVVFMKPPFAAYYNDSSETVKDPLHPASGEHVAAVEAALVKLNQLSYSLYPNHYALTRMMTASIFANQRESLGKDREERAAIRKKTNAELESLISQYEALPPLDAADYAAPMQMQILFAYGSAYAFLAVKYSDQALNNAKSEAAFKQSISIGDQYIAAHGSSARVLNEGLLARIFYASYFWNSYKDTNPGKIYDILRPLLTEQSKQTTVYLSYLPSHKDATVPPFTTLREIAQSMPEFKTFLQGRGWVF